MSSDIRHPAPSSNGHTRALVLGSSGRIGRMLRHSWARDSGGIDFTYQTRDPAAAHGTDVLWDVMQELPEALLEAPAFDCMIVLSGIVPKPGADFSLNRELGAAALKAAGQLGIKTVFLASTSAVYGTYQTRAYLEDDPTRPVNAYGQSKLAMEIYCQKQAAALGITLCALRIGNVAGADALLANAQALPPGGRLRLDRFPDQGTPLRSYIGPQTLARVLSVLVHKRKDLPAVLNIATPRPVTMEALARCAAAPFDLVQTRDQGHQYITLECSAVGMLYNFDSIDSDPGEMVRQWQAVRSL